jgi:cell division protease FtsH
VLSRAAAAAAGAELANIVNEALLLVARRGAEVVQLQDLLAGIQRTRYGINGRSGDGLGPQAALGKRLGRWLLNAAQSKDNGKLVKVATS